MVTKLDQNQDVEEEDVHVKQTVGDLIRTREMSTWNKKKPVNAIMESPITAKVSGKKRQDAPGIGNAAGTAARDTLLGT